MKDPAWIVEARKHIGLKEEPGAGNNPTIVKWWKDIKRGGITQDSVPWCAAFVGSCLERVGIESTRYESAKSYLNWGRPIPEAVYGCIAVFNRDGGGHVGYPVGIDAQGRLMVIGGNQNDSVSIAPFNVDRVAGYRWPTGVPISTEPLPLIASNEKSSVNEA